MEKCSALCKSLFARLSANLCFRIHYIHRLSHFAGFNLHPNITNRHTYIEIMLS